MNHQEQALKYLEWAVEAGSPEQMQAEATVGVGYALLAALALLEQAPRVWINPAQRGQNR